MPTSLVIMAKSMITMEGIGLTLYPEFEIREEFEKVVEKILWEMNDPRTIFRTFMIDLVQNRDLFVRMPSQLSRVIDGLSESGEKSVVNVDSGVDRETVLAGALLLGGSFLLLQSLPPLQAKLLGILEIAAAALLFLR